MRLSRSFIGKLKEAEGSYRRNLCTILDFYRKMCYNKHAKQNFIRYSYRNMYFYFLVKTQIPFFRIPYTNIEKFCLATIGVVRFSVRQPRLAHFLFSREEYTSLLSPKNNYFWRTYIMAIAIIICVVIFFFSVSCVSGCLEESCNVSSDSSFALASVILVGAFLVIGVLLAMYFDFEDKEKKKEHMDGFKKSGISTNKCVFSQYGCTIYKDNNILAYSNLGSGISGISNTGSFSINSRTTVCVKYKTGYSSRIQSKHDMTLGAMAGLFDVDVILHDNDDDNCIKCIWAEYNTDGKIDKIPISAEEREINSVTQNLLNDINAKIQNTLR